MDIIRLFILQTQKLKNETDVICSHSTKNIKIRNVIKESSSLIDLDIYKCVHRRTQKNIEKQGLSVSSCQFSVVSQQ